MKYLKSKKSNLLDIQEIAMILISTGIIFFIMYLVLSNFSTTIKANNYTNITTVTENMDNHISTFYLAVDYGFLLIAVLFTAMAYVLARYIPSDSVYLIIVFVISFLFILFSFIISNLHGNLMDNLLYLEFVNMTTYYEFLMPKLPFLAIIQFILICLGLYTKSEN